MLFRKDINGLRAFAVIGVVLFHFNAQWLTGGFSGVDVFFVISGYLMTAIIFTKLDNNQFSLWAFYQSRAKRIVPPLAALCLSLLLFGWFYLYSEDFKALAKHALTSMTFLSNFIYANEDGYFTAAVTEKWLLHTWSLSVEWQFYIIYPLMIFGLQKYLKPTQIRPCLIGLTSISFLLALYGSYHFPDKAFFHLPTRAWELLIGGIIFLYPMKLSTGNKHVMSSLGLLLVAVSYLYLVEADLWPGYLTLLPILGASLVLMANNQSSVILNNALAQRLGSASYSIYLWHWPVYVYLYHEGLAHQPSMLFAGISVSLMLGWACYYFIEQYNKRPSFTLLMPKPLYLCLPIIFISTGIYSLNGVNMWIRPLSQSPQAEFITSNKHIDLEGSYYDQCNAYKSLKSHNNTDIAPECVASKGKPGVFLWGDSHAQALSLGIRTSLPKGVEFYQVASSGCKPSLVAKGITSTLGLACDSSNQLALKAIASIKPVIVILAQAEQHEQTNWHDMQAVLKDLGVDNVVVIGPIPQWRPSLPLVIAKRHWNEDEPYLTDNAIDQQIITTDHLLHKQLDKHVSYISLIDSLCINQGLSCQARVDKAPLVFDYGHLTPEGSLLVSQKIIIPHLIELVKNQQSSTSKRLAMMDLTESKYRPWLHRPEKKRSRIREEINHSSCYLQHRQYSP